MTVKMKQLCPLCQSARKLTLSKKARLYSARHVGLEKGSLRTVICRDCGCVYRDPLPTVQEIDHYYTQEYYEKYKNVKNRTDFNIDEFTDIKRKYVQLMMSKGVNLLNKKVIDIGAGRGALLQAISEAKPEYLFGIEPSSTIVDWIKDTRNYSFEISNYSWNEFQNSDDKNYKKGFYDIAILHSVVEHLTDPIETLSSIKHILSNQGKLVIYVPNEEPRPWMDIYKRLSFVHLLYFSKYTLAQLLELAGYEIQRIELVENSNALFCIATNNSSIWSRNDTNNKKNSQSTGNHSAYQLWLKYNFYAKLIRLQLMKYAVFTKVQQLVH